MAHPSPLKFGFWLLPGKNDCNWAVSAKFMLLSNFGSTKNDFYIFSKMSFKTLLHATSISNFARNTFYSVKVFLNLQIFEGCCDILIIFECDGKNSLCLFATIFLLAAFCSYSIFLQL